MERILAQIRELNERLATWQIDGETYERILDQLPDGVIVVTPTGDIRFVNETIERMFGYLRAQLVGRSIHILLEPSLAEVHAAHLTEFFANPSPRPMGGMRHFAGRTSLGNTVTVQISIASVGALGVAVVRSVQNG